MLTNLASTPVRWILALALAGSMWLFVQRILIPHQIADSAAHDHPRGNLSDLYPRWLGARELFLHGRDPYHSDITHEIQTGYYGRAISPSRPGDSSDEQAFAYPVYVVFLLAPSVNLPFRDVARVFFWLLWLASGLSVWLWLRALKWETTLSTNGMAALFFLSSVPFIQGVKLEQISLLIAFLLACCPLLFVNGYLAFAGMLLAIATVKPQLVVPLVIWLTVWSFSGWRQRKNFLFGFLFTMAILLAGAEWILPGWGAEFLRGVAAYRKYANAKSLFEELTNPTWGVLISLGVVAITAALCWRLRLASQRSTEFVFAFALIMAVTVVIIPSVSTYNQVLLLPGVLLLVKELPKLWNRNRVSRVVSILAGLTISWPWFAALGLTISSFFVPAAAVEKAWTLPFYTSLAMPVAVLCLLFQYAFMIGNPAQEATVPSFRSQIPS